MFFSRYFRSIFAVSAEIVEIMASELAFLSQIAIFMYELEQNLYKVSLRSGDIVDVNTVAQYFGGGGHKKAAGVTMNGTSYDVINNLAFRIELQLRGTV